MKRHNLLLLLLLLFCNISTGSSCAALVNKSQHCRELLEMGWKAIHEHLQWKLTAASPATRHAF